MGPSLVELSCIGSWFVVRGSWFESDTEINLKDTTLTQKRCMDRKGFMLEQRMGPVSAVLTDEPVSFAIGERDDERESYCQ